MKIATVEPGDVADLLPMLRAYLDFYEVHPSDDALEFLARHLIDHPDEGTQLIARSDSGEALGFATIYWTWQTLTASRAGVLNDLWVEPDHRGTGLAEALIAAALDRAREHGASELAWETAPDNHRAQRVYDRVGGRREESIAYSLPTSTA